MLIMVLKINNIYFNSVRYINLISGEYLELRYFYFSAIDQVFPGGIDFDFKSKLTI